MTYSKKYIQSIRQLLSSSSRLTYVFESALLDLAQFKNERQLRLSQNGRGVILRSKFGEINILYLHGEINIEDLQWISNFSDSCEIHCESVHERLLHSSSLSTRIIASDLVAYYKLDHPLITTTSLKPQKIEANHLSAVSELVQAYSDDPIHYPGMYELPSYGIWLNGQLVAMAATLYINSQTHDCQIGGFLTHPDFRGKGLARALAHILIDELTTQGMKSIRLEVYSKNIKARKLYESLGFVLENESPMIVLK